MDLYAIIRLDTNEFVWSSVTTHDEAECAAVSASFRYGPVSLLSGVELGQHLLSA